MVHYYINPSKLTSLFSPVKLEIRLWWLIDLYINLSSNSNQYLNQTECQWNEQISKRMTKWMIPRWKKILIIKAWVCRRRIRNCWRCFEKYVKRKQDGISSIEDIPRHWNFYGLFLSYTLSSLPWFYKHEHTFFFTIALAWPFCMKICFKIIPS